MTVLERDERYVEAPSLRKPDHDGHCLFLAGGISDCADWQRDLASMILAGTDKVTVFNPRRAHFPALADKAEASRQIAWEYRRLLESTVVSFWFTNTSLQPIALFELGRWSHPESEKKIFVGVEPGYAREVDIRFQLALSKPTVEVVDTLEALSHQVLAFMRRPR